MTTQKEGEKEREKETVEYCNDCGKLLLYTKLQKTNITTSAITFQWRMGH